jgi:hypothetical protein
MLKCFVVSQFFRTNVYSGGAKGCQFVHLGKGRNFGPHLGLDCPNSPAIGVEPLGKECKRVSPTRMAVSAWEAVCKRIDRQVMGSRRNFSKNKIKIFACFCSCLSRFVGEYRVFVENRSCLFRVYPIRNRVNVFDG